jgi:mRNA interferase MazF
MKIGDIILIPFPFSELNKIKVRPAVIIKETQDKYNDYGVSAISSVLPEHISEREVFIPANNVNHLRVDSVIKVDRIVTVRRDQKIADLGKLSSRNLAEFKSILLQMIK